MQVKLHKEQEFGLGWADNTILEAGEYRGGGKSMQDSQTVWNGVEEGWGDNTRWEDQRESEEGIGSEEDRKEGGCGKDGASDTVDGRRREGECPTEGQCKREIN